MTEIRILQQQDIPTLARLHAQSRRSTYAGILSQDALDRITDIAAESYWRARLAEAVFCRVVLVSLRQSDLCGFAMLTRDNEEVATLNHLHVRADAHGGGHGTRLLEEAHWHALGWGCRSLQLFVATANAHARAFYARRGWIDDRSRRDHVIAGETLPIARYRRAVTAEPRPVSHTVTDGSLPRVRPEW